MSYRVMSDDIWVMSDAATKQGLWQMLSFYLSSFCMGYKANKD